MTLLAPDTAGVRTDEIALVVFDMAGTTVRDDGIVERAFGLAAERTGVAADLGWDAALQHVRDTMGQSKFEVFRHIAGGDVKRAAEATTAFERAYDELIAAEGAEALPGAAAVFDALRAAGRSVVLTTGFAPVTRDAIIDALGWRDRIDAAFSPADVDGHGRPAPDLVLRAALAVHAPSVARIAVVGDTTSDMRSGRAAGAGLVIGVTSGAHDRAALEAAGADLVVDSVADLRGIAGLGI